METILTLEIILNSGYRFIISCNQSDINGNIDAKSLEKIISSPENNILYINPDEIALVRVISKSEESCQTQHSTCKPVKYGETFPLNEKCPICHQSDKTYIYSDSMNKEYLAYCERCDVETTERYKSKESVTDAFSKGKIQPANMCK